MDFESILYETSEDRPVDAPQLPGFFIDLNLDQIVETIIRNKKEYNLEPFFWYPLKRISAIRYRHEVMRELEREEIIQVVNAFAQRMHSVREYLLRSNRLSHNFQSQRWFLDAVDVYCDTVTSLYHGLSMVELNSPGFSAFREYLQQYINSESFKSLTEETQELKDEIASIRYCIHVKGKYLTVRKPENEEDFSTDIENVLDRFKLDNSMEYLARYSEPVEMNSLESTILGAVVQLYPEIFEELYSYHEQHAGFLDETIVGFDREIQFYVSYLEFITTLREAGLHFCYPEISDSSKEIYQVEGFDLSLANKLVAEERPIVCNDFNLKDKERICVVSGPNQGGKTSFARSIGQSHYLARLGCPVPGKEAALFLYDTLFTHFEEEENTEDLRSKLEDDLTRIHGIISEATSDSLVIANEVLTSTTLNDSIFLGKKVMDSLSHLDLLCVWVTFVEELVSYSEKAVSMVSMADPDNPSLRTYKILRRDPHGISYATAIADKYGLTFESLKERIQ
ncbi:MAG: hypothetical protein JW712_12490 [Dehalococcoidales bacterium]|nr:hypothetical protein [Dehalococcoidales bacterium]